MTLTLNKVNHFFCITLWLMMLHNYTKFSDKMFCGSEDILWTTFSNTLNLCCDLDLELSNPFFHKTLWLMMLYYQTKFGCKGTSSLEDIVKIVIS